MQTGLVFVHNTETLKFKAKSVIAFYIAIKHNYEDIKNTAPKAARLSLTFEVAREMKKSCQGENSCFSVFVPFTWTNQLLHSFCNWDTKSPNENSIGGLPLFLLWEFSW